MSGVMLVGLKGDAGIKMKGELRDERGEISCARFVLVVPNMVESSVNRPQ